MKLGNLITNPVPPERPVSDKNINFSFSIRDEAETERPSSPKKRESDRFQANNHADSYEENI